MTTTTNKSRKLNLIALLVLSALSSNSFAEETYSFSTTFLKGKNVKADLTKYTETELGEGVYPLDVYLNGEWKGRHDLQLVKQKDGHVGVCYTKQMLTLFGIAVDRLNAKLAKESDFCGGLSEWNDNKDVSDNIDRGGLKLTLSVPQIYQNQSQRGYVDVSLWDTGIPALNVGWNGNIWNSHYSALGSTDATTGYLGIDANASLAGWSLKHKGNVTWSDKKSAEYNSNKTYLQRPIPQIKSLFSVGQVNSTGEFFDSITVRGAVLKTDNAMYPDSVLNFAPEIRGEARTSALVTVKQNDRIIHQTTVPPGPFVISDIYPSGYGNNLEVTVKEADGAESYFVVPYNNLTRLVRPGIFRYEILAGKADDSFLQDKPVVYQATAQYGFNNILTGYAGFSGFNHYQSYLVGAGVNTALGGFSFDITSSNLATGNRSEKGNMYRATYNRSFDATSTSVAFTAAQYSDKGFYTLSNALAENDRGGKYYTNEKSSVTFSVNQSLPSGWGSFYASASAINYWDDAKKRTQYQMGYSNNFRGVSYSVNAQKALSTTSGRQTSDNRVSLNFSIPLNFGEGHRNSLSSRTLVDNSRYSNTQIGLNGTMGENSDISYGINTTVGDSKTVSLNGGYRSSLATINGNFSQGSEYRQTSISGSGSFVAHSGGVTFTPESNDTVVLVEAKGAKGARVASSLGAKVDANGFAVVSSVRPYRVNSVVLDPKGAEENVYFNETMKQAVPYQGSVVKVTFDTEVQDNILFKGKLRDGKPFPFGASVYNMDGREIGTVGQGGLVFIKDGSSPKATVKWEKGACSFTLPKKEKGEVVCE